MYGPCGLSFVNLTPRVSEAEGKMKGTTQPKKPPRRQTGSQLKGEVTRRHPSNKRQYPHCAENSHNSTIKANLVKKQAALAGWLLGWRTVPYTTRLKVRSWVRARTWVVGSIPSQGAYGRQPITVSLKSINVSSGEELETKKARIRIWYYWKWHAFWKSNMGLVLGKTISRS